MLEMEVGFEFFFISPALLQRHARLLEAGIRRPHNVRQPAHRVRHHQQHRRIRARVQPTDRHIESAEIPKRIM